jgi:cytochrome c
MHFHLRLSALVPAVAALGVLLSVHVQATASQPLAEKGGCNVCHAPDKKILGPSWRDIAVKYKGQADAVALLSQRVRKGSQGVWGPVPMPPTDAKKLNDADVKTVVTWLLKPPA